MQAAYRLVHTASLVTTAVSLPFRVHLPDSTSRYIVDIMNRVYGMRAFFSQFFVSRIEYYGYPWHLATPIVGLDLYRQMKRDMTYRFKVVTAEDTGSPPALVDLPAVSYPSFALPDFYLSYVRLMNLLIKRTIEIVVHKRDSGDGISRLTPADIEGIGLTFDPTWDLLTQFPFRVMADVLGLVLPRGEDSAEKYCFSGGDFREFKKEDLDGNQFYSKTSVVFVRFCFDTVPQVALKLLNRGCYNHSSSMLAALLTIYNLQAYLSGLNSSAKSWANGMIMCVRDTFARNVPFMMATDSLWPWLCPVGQYLFTFLQEVAKLRLLPSDVKVGAVTNPAVLDQMLRPHRARNPKLKANWPHDIEPYPSEFRYPRDHAQYKETVADKSSVAYDDSQVFKEAPDPMNSFLVAEDSSDSDPDEEEDARAVPTKRPRKQSLSSDDDPLQ
jgi:hypothetical protein